MPPVVKYMQNTKFLVGDSPVWVDFFFFELLELMVLVTDGGIFADFPELIEYHKNVASLPNLKEYLESDDCREKTLNFNNKHAKINGGSVTELVKKAYQ